MFIRKKTLFVYIALLILTIIISHMIMIMNRADVIEKEKEMAILSALSDYESSNGQAVNGENDFFVNYRLERESVRSKHMDTLKELIASDDANVKQKAQAELQQLLNFSELESQVENLLKARGFKDIVIFWSGDEVSAVVLDENFNSEKATQICDTVSRMLHVDFSHINIIQK